MNFPAASMRALADGAKCDGSDSYRHVVIAMDASLQNARGIMLGIAAYCRNAEKWSLHVDTRCGERHLQRTWLQWADGVIVSGTPAIASELCEAGIPAINVMEQGISDIIPTVCVDNFGAGQAVAEHLIERGFERFFGFVKEGHAAGMQRYAGFAGAIETAGLACGRMPILAPRNEQVEWMAAQSAPIGVLGYHDGIARDLIEAAWEAGRRVPEDVAVVGIDNDPLYCELGHATMSSVAHPLQRVGYEAARALDGWMDAGGDESHRPVAKRRIGHPALFVRESSDVWLTTDINVRKALQIIQRNYDSPIGVEQIAKSVGVSRQQLARLFRTELDQTALAVLTQQRIDAARRMLLGGKQTIASVAEACGFDSSSYFAAVFRRHTGLTPSQFRDKNTVT